MNLLVFSELESIQKFGYQHNNSEPQLSKEQIQMNFEVMGIFAYGAIFILRKDIGMGGPDFTLCSENVLMLLGGWFKKKPQNTLT